MRDTEQNTAADLAPKKSSARTFRQEVREGRRALQRSGSRLFVSGFSAGLEVGLSLLLIAIVRTASDGLVNRLALDLLTGTIYSFGFVVIILGRSELFTERTTLAVLSLLAGKTTFGTVARCVGNRPSGGGHADRHNTWDQFGHFLLLTTIGNAIGGAIFVALLKFGQARSEPGRAHKDEE